MTKKVKDILYDFANKLLNTGINGVIEKDKYMDVRIVGFSDRFNKTLTVQDIANDKLYESNEAFNDSNAVIIVESAEDFTYEPKGLVDSL